MNDYPDKTKEVREAIAAGQRALDALNDAERYLSSARNWGLFDMLGGGLFSSLIKHSKMDDAQRCMERAQNELARFAREVQDVQSFGTVQVNFDGMTQFIDIVFDNFLVDLLIQSRIGDAQQSVYEAKQKVEHALAQLRAML